MRCFIICLFLVFYVKGSVLLAQQGQIVWTAQEIQKQFYHPVVKRVTWKFVGLNDTTRLAATIKKSPSQLPQNFYTQNMGAVCKIELSMQKQIKFPLFIRMGSKDYVDGLEGKYGLRRY